MLVVIIRWKKIFAPSGALFTLIIRTFFRWIVSALVFPDNYVISQVIVIILMWKIECFSPNVFFLYVYESFHLEVISPRETMCFWKDTFYAIEYNHSDTKLENLFQFLFPNFHYRRKIYNIYYKSQTWSNGLD